MKTAVQQPIPNRSGRFVVAEPHDLDVIHLPQCNINGKLVSKRFILGRIRNRLVRMNVANDCLLLMSNISHDGVCGEQARRRSVGISGITGNQEVAGEIQQAKMSPIAGVIFLGMKE